MSSAADCWLLVFLLNAAWQLLGLLLVTALLLRLLPSPSGQLQYRLWVSCLLLAVVLPAVSASLAMQPTRHAPPRRSDDPLRWKRPRSPDSSRLTLRFTEIPSLRSPGSRPGFVPMLYLACLLARFLWLLLRLQQTRRLIRHATRLELDAASRRFLATFARTFDLGPVQVLASSGINGPATATWPSPVILLPLTFAALPAGEAAAVLAHELAHVHRNDFETNLLLECLASLLVFHPAAWWLKRRIAVCREMACDDLAADATSGRMAYAQTLLHLAQGTPSRSASSAGLSLGLSRTSDLERRLTQLMQTPRSLPPGRYALRHAVCVAALCASALAAVLLSLHPSPVHAAGVPSFPFDPTQTFDDLTPAVERKLAPDFTLVDNNGRTITLSDYRGKVVLLDFWATWCGGCKLEIPWYMEFDRKYRASGLAVIGVSMDEKGWEVVRPFLAKGKDDETGGRIAMQYPVVIGDDALARKFGLTSMPMTLLIDRDGKIAVVHTGVVDKSNFESNLRGLLK